MTFVARILGLLAFAAWVPLLIGSAARISVFRPKDSPVTGAAAVKPLTAETEAPPLPDAEGFPLDPQEPRSGDPGYRELLDPRQLRQFRRSR